MNYAGLYEYNVLFHPEFKKPKIIDKFLLKFQGIRFD